MVFRGILVNMVHITDCFEKMGKENWLSLYISIKLNHLKIHNFGIFNYFAIKCLRHKTRFYGQHFKLLKTVFTILRFFALDDLSRAITPIPSILKWANNLF